MFTSILSSIIIWSAVLIIALRVVTNSGIQFSNNKYISELTCYKGTSVSYTHLDVYKRQAVYSLL